MLLNEPWSVWGEVPFDEDVIPFSRLNPFRGDQGRNNKRHHFVPATYMDGFSDPDGRVWVYRLDAAEEPLHLKPPATAYERYYYSQKLPGGGQENHRFEDLWGVIEEVWPVTLRAVRAGRLSPAISFNVLGMVSSLKARVPAARDRNAILMAAELRASAQALESTSQLPAEFENYRGKLGQVPVAANPQRTLRTVFDDIKEFGDLCCRMGFEVVHNTSDVPFITSDNPVCYYDPSQSLQRRTPYDVGREIELICPLDASTLLRGSHRLAPTNTIVRHKILTDASAVRRYNRTISEFSYRLMIARDRADAVARMYAGRCPTIDVDVAFEGTDGRHVKIYWRHVFAARPKPDPYIDTPEKAARLQAEMEVQGVI